MVLKKSYRGVAAASKERIVGSAEYFQRRPQDVGAMVHETVHVVQHYPARKNPGWLTEGIADYIRSFKFEPGTLGPINADRAHYNGSYHVSAAFLAYVSEEYDKQLIGKLNAACRQGKYQDEIFKQPTGKTLAELDEEWRASLWRKS
jgi:Peptidase of plants and bacteria